MEGDIVESEVYQLKWHSTSILHLYAHQNYKNMQEWSDNRFITSSCSHTHTLPSHSTFHYTHQIQHTHSLTQAHTHTLPFTSHHHHPFIHTLQTIHLIHHPKWGVFWSSSDRSHWESVDGSGNQEIRFLSKGNRWTANEDECGWFE